MGRRKGVRFGRLEAEPGLADRVVAEYLAGDGLRAIQRRHRVGWDALRATLVDRGVTIRPIGRAGRPWERPDDSGPLDQAELTRLRAAVEHVSPGQRAARSS